MSGCPGFWNLLHDATIEGIGGVVPGVVGLTLKCDYLRSRFEAPGDRFILELNGCTRFEFQSWSDDSILVSDMNEIAAQRLSILSGDWMEDHCKIYCSRSDGEIGGNLFVSADAFHLSLDNGQPVSFEQLDAISLAYWSEFSARGKKLRGE